MNNNILSQINDLKTLTMKQLRQRWLVLFALLRAWFTERLPHGVSIGFPIAK
jgi:hypothetical protein